MSDDYPRFVADEEIVAALGRAIRLLRFQLDLTQEEVALESGVNRSYMSAVERGERNPSLKTLVKIANGLGVPLLDLLTRTCLFPDELIVTTYVRRGSNDGSTTTWRVPSGRPRRRDPT